MIVVVYWKFAVVSRVTLRYIAYNHVQC